MLELSPDEYFNMLPKHYQAKVEGYNSKVRFDSELLRQHAFITVSPYMKEGSNYSTFKNSFPLPWDERSEQFQPVQMTQEEIKELLEMHNKIEIYNG